MLPESKIEKILKSNKKPKEIVTLLAQALNNDKTLVNELIGCFKAGSTADKGNCIEALEYVTQQDPEFAENCLDFVIESLTDKAPRVKWEASRIIGNVAKRFPKEVSKAIPKLLENTMDKGTVVRWSAAFALTEIAKSNLGLQKELVNKFVEILAKETNNGVKNVYLKALKFIDKNKG
ncbi:MAG TPA: hypothetical protein VF399_08200 [bacterium]